MRFMKKIIIILSAIAAMACGCAKMSKTALYEADSSLKKTGEVTLCVSIEDLATKLVADDNGHFLFAKEDSIQVFCSDGTPVVFHLDGTGDTKKAFFKGTIPAGREIGSCIAYPVDNTNSFASGKLLITLDDEFTYGDTYACPMAGVIGDDFNVKLYQLAADFKVTANNFPAGISAVRFSDKGGKCLTGMFNYDITGLGKEGIHAEEGSDELTIKLKNLPATPCFTFPLPIGDYSGIEIELIDEDGKTIGSQPISEFPISTARGSVARAEFSSTIKVRNKQVVVDNKDSFKMTETSEGIWEAKVPVLSSSTIVLNIDSELFGFASYSGAGGIGGCKNVQSALPYYNYKDVHTKLYYVEKAIGECQKINEGGNAFWINLDKAGYVRVVYDSTYGANGSYYLELVKDEDPSLIFDEQFDLFTCGGDVVWYIQGTKYGEDPAAYDGIATGTPKKCNWNASGSSNAMWDYPTKVASTVAGSAYMKNRNVEGWAFARVDERPGAIQMQQGNNYDSFITTPKLSAISGTQNMKLTLVIARYSSTSASEIYVDILGGGEFVSAHVDQTASTSTSWQFDATSTDLTGLSGSRFTIDATTCVTVPSTGNTATDKPVSTFVFDIKNATADTQIKISAPFKSSNAPRCCVYGIKATKN